MTEWGTVALYAGLLVGLGIVILLASRLLGPRRIAREKMEPYECGVPILSPVRQRFPVHFYLVAIVFILFDIETVFLIPWAVIFRSLGVAGLVEMGAFLLVVAFGLVYVWRRGVLDWE